MPYNTSILAQMYAAFHETDPVDIQDIFEKYNSKYNLRRQNCFVLPKTQHKLSHEISQTYWN